MILYNNINSLPLFSNNNRYFLWISNSLLIYYLGYLGIYYNGIFKQRVNIRKNSRIVKKELTPKNDNKIEKIKNEILREKAFLNSNLNLASIAEKHNLNESYLSHIFNKNSNTNFSTYINKLRVKESKKLLVDEAFKNYDIISIALESGFNSKSAFYNAFKKETGLTPTQYRKQNLS
ncbi:helix-turn-helix domain-containing protein [Polaribacter cellanae]|uniref:Helix-turn-helix transcriptional regulator n=1 Tax=Polaribacter cellanae TaxID=2818493 RepID=A0A975CLB4_9FLAO|nr:AraC family transcriptional regulator [Polaribacter cellanae]QTE21783.1 helix-turn-helix transcriptional regulator [Polaribacter cellanae]